MRARGPSISCVGPSRTSTAGALSTSRASCCGCGRGDRMDDALDAFSIRLPVLIRPCVAADLPALEDFARFVTHDVPVAKLYDQHCSGQALILVAEVNGE